MSEEIQNAGLNVPRGIWGSYLLGAITGFVMLVTFCFAYTPAAIGTSTGFPFIQVYLDATGSVGGALALIAVLILLILYVCPSVGLKMLNTVADSFPLSL